MKYAPLAIPFYPSGIGRNRRPPGRGERASLPSPSPSSLAAALQPRLFFRPPVRIELPTKGPKGGAALSAVREEERTKRYSKRGADDGKEKASAPSRSFVAGGPGGRGGATETRERSGGSPDEGTSPPSFRNGAIGEVVGSRGYVRRRISPSSSFLRLTSLSLHSPRVEGFNFGHSDRFEGRRRSKEGVGLKDGGWA
ncbi:hypothetical protein ACHAWF_009585 [Thalassiosira exigua]